MMEDFENGLTEVHPAFGVSEDEIASVVQNGIYYYSDGIEVNSVPSAFDIRSYP